MHQIRNKCTWGFFCFLRLGDCLVAEKRTYEELEQRVKKLEKEAAERKWAKGARSLLSFPRHTRRDEDGQKTFWSPHG